MKNRLFKTNPTLFIGLLLFTISIGPLLFLNFFGLLDKNNVFTVLAGVWAMITTIPSMLILTIGIIIAINKYLKSKNKEINLPLRTGISLLVISKAPDLLNRITPRTSMLSEIMSIFTFLNFLFYPSLLLIIIGIVLYSRNKNASDS